jgi:hypothetical protein
MGRMMLLASRVFESTKICSSQTEPVNDVVLLIERKISSSNSKRKLGVLRVISNAAVCVAAQLEIHSCRLFTLEDGQRYRSDPARNGKVVLDSVIKRKRGSRIVEISVHEKENIKTSFVSYH